MSKKGPFASARVEKLIRDAGAERVSSDAVDALNDYLGEHGLEVAKKAVEFARHMQRKTIKADDIKLALQK